MAPVTTTAPIPDTWSLIALSHVTPVPCEEIWRKVYTDG
jgi:hypothetical protein